MVLPIYNEAESLPLLFEACFRSCAAEHYRFEILAVNDGSKDASSEVLSAWSDENPEVRVIHFARNYGQTAALMAGFDQSRGEVVVTLDADLQNDPRDIPRLIAKIDEGYRRGVRLAR